MKKYEPVFISGILAGVLTFLTTFLITFYWQKDGLSEIETLLLVVLGSFLYLIILIPFTIISGRQFISSKHLNKEKTKRRYVLYIMLITSLLVYVLLDTLFFLFDDSLSQAYIEYLNQLDTDQKTAEPIEDILPIGLLNIFQMTVSGMIAMFISLLCIQKKNNDR